MWMNNGLFRDNGGIGYVLKPPSYRMTPPPKEEKEEKEGEEKGKEEEKEGWKGGKEEEKEKMLRVQVLGGRFLPTGEGGIGIGWGDKGDDEEERGGILGGEGGLLGGEGGLLGGEGGLLGGEGGLLGGEVGELGLGMGGEVSPYVSVMIHGAVEDCASQRTAVVKVMR